MKVSEVESVERRERLRKVAKSGCATYTSNYVTCTDGKRPYTLYTRVDRVEYCGRLGNSLRRSPRSFSRTNEMAFVSHIAALPRATAPRTSTGRCDVRMARERTFIAVKPDGVNRGVVGKIISRFEDRGFQLIGLKALVPPRSLAETHYAALSSKPFYPDLVDFISSGPVCAMVWEGEDAVTTARKMIGETNPRASNPGTSTLFIIASSLSF